jgi:hypothetical protein
MENRRPLSEGEKVQLYCGVPAVSVAFGGMLLSAESINGSVNAAVDGEITALREQNYYLHQLGGSAPAGTASPGSEIAANKQLLSNLVAHEPLLTSNEMLGLDMGLSLIGGLAVGGIIYAGRRLWQECRQPKAVLANLGEFKLDLSPAQGEF